MLPVIDRTPTEQQVFGECLQTAVKADDDASEAVHTRIS
jgi:hypothetical protein